MNLNCCKNLLLLGLSAFVLSGCATGAGTGPLSTRVEVETLQQQLLTLPGAVVDLKTLTVAYPGDALFAPGAVLPFPGGVEVLDPLMTWMLQADEFYGEARVRSAGHAPERDQVLAEKRRELLERLFRNRGVMSDRLTFSVEESSGAPLEIRFQLRSPATSSGGNS